ncbi:class F sortase [Nocardioides sp. KC13]|uniref:Class F sortase n=1 Tax=Nocardioides turkmenicus TaxID=2711220 RepID=A0A6M1R8Y4_9ACTN|nr:class F sortase [Nocardioides sp. KC13]NGN95071.1 class F sortase [Nocardioides sp. KC13]
MNTPAPAPGRGLLAYLGLACSVLLITAGLAIGLGTGPGEGPSGPAAPRATDPRVPETHPAYLSREGVDEDAPVRLEIPAIGIDQRLLRLGLDKHKQLQVPTMAQADRPGWYRYSPIPGDIGPSVIAGHVDTTEGPAVFYRLRELDKGDTIRVHRADGQLAVFTVTKVRLVRKSRFPTKEVYGPIRYAGLRLITCGGGYNQDRGGYQRNLVVFAKLERPLNDA